MFLKRKLKKEIAKQEEWVTRHKARVYDKTLLKEQVEELIKITEEKIKTLKTVLNALY